MCRLPCYTQNFISFCLNEYNGKGVCGIEWVVIKSFFRISVFFDFVLHFGFCSGPCRVGVRFGHFFVKKDGRTGPLVIGFVIDLTTDFSRIFHGFNARMCMPMTHLAWSRVTVPRSRLGAFVPRSLSVRWPGVAARLRDRPIESPSYEQALREACVLCNL